MYRLVKFGTTALEYANQVDTIGSGATPVSYFGLPEGGALDGYGGASKQPGVVERSKVMRLTAGSEAGLEGAFFGLLGLRGRRERLYRRTAGGDIHWMYARLVEVAAERNFEQARYRLIQDVELRFACQEATWHGAWRGGWALDGGVYLDSGYDLVGSEVFVLDEEGRVTWTVTIGSGEAGRAATRAVRILIANHGATAVTGVTVANATSGDEVEFSGTLGAGSTLLIDTGRMQATIDGADAYDDLVLAPGADMAAWFTLLPGDNYITVTRVGGTGGEGWPEITFEFFEEWY